MFALKEEKEDVPHQEKGSVYVHLEKGGGASVSNRGEGQRKAQK